MLEPLRCRVATLAHRSRCNASPERTDRSRENEAARLVAAADPEWSCMIILALKAGLRQGELLTLRREGIDLVTGLLRVRRSVTRGFVTEPKSGKGRDIPLGDDLSARPDQAARRSTSSRVPSAAATRSSMSSVGL